MACPKDTNGDGNCGDKYCAYCGVNAVQPKTDEVKPAESSWMLDLLPEVGMGTDEQLLFFLNGLADNIARQHKNFALSSRIRQTLENPDSNPKAYAALLNCAKFNIVGDLFTMFANIGHQCANGLLMEALGDIPKYLPAIAVPDSQFGRFIMDSFDDMHQLTGASDPFKRVSLDNPNKPKKKIIVDE